MVVLGPLCGLQPATEAFDKTLPMLVCTFEQEKAAM